LKRGKMMKVAGSLLCLFFALLVSSCAQKEYYKGCWEPVFQSPTNIVPMPGSYFTQAEIDLCDGGYCGKSSKSEWFTVLDTATLISFSSDRYRYDSFPISAGIFSYIHGGNYDYSYCPTDGYSISGRFISATTATGHYQSIPACGCGVSFDFEVYLRL
jgi:hypothetical protein